MRANKRESLDGPASKTMVLYTMGMVPLGMRLTMGVASTIMTGLCSGVCMYLCNMFVLPSLTQRLLNKKNKKVTYRPVSFTPVTNREEEM